MTGQPAVDFTMGDPRGDCYYSPSRTAATDHGPQWSHEDVQRAHNEGRHDDITDARRNGQLRDVLHGR